MPDKFLFYKTDVLLISRQQINKCQLEYPYPTLKIMI